MRVCFRFLSQLAMAAAVALSAAVSAAEAVTDVFDEQDAVQCTATVAIYDDDAQAAHARALENAFAQAVRSASASEGFHAGREEDRPEKSVTAYRIVEQKRRDLEYTLSVLVWTTLPKRGTR